MAKPRQDGLYLLAFGIAVFVLFGSALRLKVTATDTMDDFRMPFIGTSCLMHHGDPYHPEEFLQSYWTQFESTLFPGARRSDFVTLFVYFPTIFLFVAPFALLPWWLGSMLWMLLTAVSLILAACLTWKIGARDAPILSGGLIALLLANSAIVLGNGNPAGLAVGLCAIAVCCFLQERFVPAGILCLAVSLSIKPHVVGLVWLYFLMAGGVHRKRAWQTLAVAVVIFLVSAVWVSSVAPQWVPEMRANLAEVSSHGSSSDPGPDGIVSKTRNMNEITALQSVFSVFRDDPRFYNPASYLLCGTLLLAGAIATLRAQFSPTLAWFALAAFAPLTQLATYHRAYDAKLLLLTVPACALLWAEGGRTAKLALLVTVTGQMLTGEITLALLLLVTKHLHLGTENLPGKLGIVFLERPAPLALLAMAAFYLWIYLRRAQNEVRLTQTKTPSPAVP